MRNKPRLLWAGFVAVTISTFVFAAADGSWLARVPAQDRARSNPFRGQQDAVTAGAILFQHNCASCHGDSAQGKGAKPSLHSARVQNATDGEIHWLLTNGNMKHGMPSWSKLPDPQRWQIVTFVHSLPLEAPNEHP